MPGLNRVRRYCRLGRHRRALLGEAAFWLVVARLAVAVLPFSLISRRLGRAMPPLSPPHRDAGPVDGELVGDVAWAVVAAARHLPFPVVCLPQALAGRIMLKRRGVGCVLSFGIPGHAGLSRCSHAWLSVGDLPVTGYPLPDGMIEIVRYL